MPKGACFDLSCYSHMIKSDVNLATASCSWLCFLSLKRSIARARHWYDLLKNEWVHRPCDIVFGSFQDKSLISSKKTNMSILLFWNNLIFHNSYFPTGLFLKTLTLDCNNLYTDSLLGYTALTERQHSWLSFSSLPLCSLDYGWFWVLWDCWGTLCAGFIWVGGSKTGLFSWNTTTVMVLWLIISCDKN